jgi:type I restriction enzyme S subunit
MSQKVPEGWQHLPFSEFADINPKRPLKKGQRVPFVEMAAVSTQGSQVQYLQEKEAVSGGARFSNGDTLFARITPCTENGKIAYVDCLAESAVAAGSTEFIVFGPRQGLSEGGYLYQLARSNFIRGPAIAQMTGTTGRQRVPNAVFDEIEIAVPPLPEQRRIAEILSSVDEAIAATQAVIDQTRTVKQGVLKRLLTKGIGHTRFKQTEIGEIPEAWEVVPLGRVAPFQPGFAFKSTEFSSQGDRLLRGSNVGVGKTLWEDEITQHFPSDRREEFSNYVLEEGDIVVAMDRPFISAGFKAARITAKDLPVLLLQRVGRFLPAQNCDVDWLWQVVSAGTLRETLERRQVGTDLPHISRTDIESCLVAIPPLDEQKEIARSVHDGDVSLSTSLAQVQYLKRVKSALMSDLLTGRKRVPMAELAAAE